MSRFELERESASLSGDTASADPATTTVRWVGGVAFRPSGNELAAAGTNHTIGIWDAVHRPAEAQSFMTAMER